jgi:hypothetical protein
MVLGFGPFSSKDSNDLSGIAPLLWLKLKNKLIGFSLISLSVVNQIQKSLPTFTGTCPGKPRRSGRRASLLKKPDLNLSSERALPSHENENKANQVLK